jgi:hypothetical protein
MAETTRNESLYHKERERKVLELYNIEGKKTRYIQKELKMSPNTINAILKRDREGKEREKEKERQRQEKKDTSAGSYDSFPDCKGSHDVLPVFLEIKTSTSTV